MNHTQSQQDALRQIDTLIRENNLSRNDVISLLNRGGDESDPASRLQKVITYIGAAFIFCGLATYIGLIWEDLGSASRVIVTLGSGFIAFLLGLLAKADERYSKAATPLLLIGAALQPVGLFVFMDEYLPKSGEIAKAASVVFGFMLLQQGIAFYARRITSLLFFTLFFFYAFLSACMDLADVDTKLAVLVMGLSGLLVCREIVKSSHASIAPFFLFWSGFAIAAASFDYLEGTVLDVALIGIVAALLYISVFLASRTLLTVSVISLLAYLVYFTDHYFKDVIGWPLALVVMGLIMIGCSAYAVKLGKKMGTDNLR